MREIEKKYGCKSLGSWAIPNEQLSFDVFEAPSSEAFQKAMMEPPILSLGAYETAEVKAAMNMEEAMKMLKPAK